jgi:hypothetical protein
MIRNVMRYVGDGYIPHEIKQQRRYVLEAMRRFGSPVLFKHRYNDQDVEAGIAETSSNFNAAFGQVRHDDPVSQGVGFVSVEKSKNEWVSPDGLSIVASSTSPGNGYVKAPKYRGYGPGFLTYIIEPDVAEDFFKATPYGPLIQVQDATVVAPWYPEMNDNDLIMHIVLDNFGGIRNTLERFQLKMGNPVSIRGLDRRGRREFTEAGGNRFVIGQTFEMVLVPPNDVTYQVEWDR